MVHRLGSGRKIILVNTERKEFNKSWLAQHTGLTNFKAVVPSSGQQATKELLEFDKRDKTFYRSALRFRADVIDFLLTERLRV